MLQTDLFEQTGPEPLSGTMLTRTLDLPALLDRLTASCERPRYNFMLLTLIAEASASTGEAGPYVRVGAERMPIRDWLCDAMNPIGRREPRRLQMTARVRDELASTGVLPDDSRAAALVVEDEVRVRLRQSGRTNVSRAVSELVRAGLLRRYYKGDYVDHQNRGGRRQAVYTITEETRRALVQKG